MNIKGYLKRINLEEPVGIDLNFLNRLHSSHLYNIPFENLDIHRGKEILLNESSLEEKIISGNRGGYCYELNGMFYLLLKELGFQVKMISARVNNGKGGWGPEFDHLAIIVELEDLWLADVGFGDNFIEPLKFELDKIQKDPNGYYKIEKYDEEYYRLMRSPDGMEFSDEYIFTLKERKWEDFREMNIYHQTSPDSHFTNNKVITIAKPDGRITLTNTKQIITENGNRRETEIRDEKEFGSKLFENFGIES
jgi:N-hydroxyarylamine O-acetyltransferase